MYQINIHKNYDVKRSIQGVSKYVYTFDWLDQIE